MIKKLLQGITMPDNESVSFGKLFTVEMAGSLALSIFLMSGMWFGLTARSEANSVSVAELKTTQNEIEKNVAAIDKNVATLLVRQEAATKSVEASMKRTTRDIQDLKRLIERMHIK